MSGNDNDPTGQNRPDLPEVELPPTPQLPPLPWEEAGSPAQGEAAAAQQPAAPQQPAQPAQPATPAPAASPDPYAAAAAAQQQAAQQQAAQQQAAGQDPYAARAAQQPPQGYGQQPGFLPVAQEPPKRKRSWIGWVVLLVVVAVGAGVYFLGTSLHWFDGRSEEKAGSEADVRLTDTAPDGLGLAWNADGITDDEWSFDTPTDYGFSGTKGGQTCSFVGVSSARADVNPEAAEAADDAAASTADFNAYLDLLGEDASIKSQDVEEAGTVAVESGEGTIEFQAYNVNINWADSSLAQTKERWYWRSFADADTAMQAYVSCGSDNISDEIDSMRELTVD